VADYGRGQGEQLERTQRRRRRTVIGVLFVAGLISGVYMGYTVADDGFGFAKPWSPTACLVLAGAYLAAMTLGSLALSRHMDEVERQAQYKAAAAAGAVYVTVYPVWFLLWKGGFAVEPIHWALFLMFWLALAISSILYRVR
jgi:F0F1-type ATP synthase assembly protein I